MKIFPIGFSQLFFFLFATVSLALKVCSKLFIFIGFILVDLTSENGRIAQIIHAGRSAVAFPPLEGVVALVLNPVFLFFSLSSPYFVLLSVIFSLWSWLQFYYLVWHCRFLTLSERILFCFVKLSHILFFWSIYEVIFRHFVWKWQKWKSFAFITKLSFSTNLQKSQVKKLWKENNQ